MGNDDFSYSKAGKLIHNQKNFKMEMNKITVPIIDLCLMGSSFFAL